MKILNCQKDKRRLLVYLYTAVCLFGIVCLVSILVNPAARIATGGSDIVGIHATGGSIGISYANVGQGAAKSSFVMYGRSSVSSWLPKYVNDNQKIVAIKIPTIPVFAFFCVATLLVRLWPLGRGACNYCGYDIANLRDGVVCPECGGVASNSETRSTEVVPTTSVIPNRPTPSDHP